MLRGSSSIGTLARLVSGGGWFSSVETGRGSGLVRTHSTARAAPGIRAAAGEGGGPPPDAPEREGGVATQTRKKTSRPDKFKVLLYNDDFTPMEFVVAILQQLFGKGPAAATQIMLQIHRSGLGVAGVYVLEVAETKVAAVHRMAEQRGYPLRAGVEKE
jgi:ATP-dependent Clp protease adaptor protein ClpS